MTRLTPFEFQAPRTLNDASQLLSQSPGEALVLAGGTDLIVGMKQGTANPKTVVWLGKIPELRQISFSENRGLTIGAMSTLSEIEQNNDVQQHYPSLVQAIRTVASPQIRHRATIGGNLCLGTRCFYFDQSDFWRHSLGYCLKYGNGICHAAPELSRCTAVFSSDLAPLLIALDATIELWHAPALRQLPLARFYENDGMNHLRTSPAEILTHVTIPYNCATKSLHSKMRSRASVDFAVANVGMALTLKDNRCESVRIVIGAVSSSPIDASEAAEELIGKEHSEATIRSVAEKAASFIRPMPNVAGAVSHRKKMVSVLVRRALHTILDSAPSQRETDRVG